MPVENIRLHALAHLFGRKVIEHIGITQACWNTKRPATRCKKNCFGNTPTTPFFENRGRLQPRHRDIGRIRIIKNTVSNRVVDSNRPFGVLLDTCYCIFDITHHTRVSRLNGGTWRQVGSVVVMSNDLLSELVKSLSIVCLIPD